MEQHHTKLTYVDGRGRGEPIRLLLDVVGVSYTEVDFTTFEELQEIRATGKLMFNQLPLLEINGLNLVQSGAIVRYLGRLGGIEPESTEHKVVADMVAGGITDLRDNLSGYMFKPDHNVALAELDTVFFPKYYCGFEKVLNDNPASKLHIVGDRMTLVDYLLFEVTQWGIELFPHSLDHYPHLKAHWENVGKQERVAAFLKSSRRKNLPDKEYVALVRKVFNF